MTDRAVAHVVPQDMDDVRLLPKLGFKLGKLRLDLCVFCGPAVTVLRPEALELGLVNQATGNIGGLGKGRDRRHPRQGHRGQQAGGSRLLWFRHLISPIGDVLFARPRSLFSRLAAKASSDLFGKPVKALLDRLVVLPPFTKDPGHQLEVAANLVEHRIGFAQPADLILPDCI